MKVFFLDTNIFLQYMDLPTLPWDKVVEGDSELLLLIPRPVQREIDALKQDGNDRRANRARLATNFVRKILQEEDLKLTIRESGPRVEISFPLIDVTVNGHLNSLNLSRSDDLIVAEALSYKTSHPDVEIYIFTGDTNLTLTAKINGIQHVQIPDDWLLARETDPRDKRIRELEQAVKKLEQMHPKIDVRPSSADGVIDGKILSVSIINYAELSVQEIDDFLATVASTFPESPCEEILEYAAQESDLPPKLFGANLKYHPPSDLELEEYHLAYEQWLKDVEQITKKLSGSLASRSRNIRLSMNMENLGSVPAENLIIEFSLFKGLVFWPPSSEIEIIETFPKPPVIPHGKWNRVEPMLRPPLFADRLALMSQNIELIRPIPDTKLFQQMIRAPAPPKHDKQAFYWKHGKPSDFTDSWTFECEEFRHQADPEIFEMVIQVPREVEAEKAVLMCRVTAKNLPQPIKFPLQIKMLATNGDALAEARRMLDTM